MRKLAMQIRVYKNRPMKNKCPASQSSRRAIFGCSNAFWRKESNQESLGMPKEGMVRLATHGIKGNEKG
jgi:hypothetical protein